MDNRQVLMPFLNLKMLGQRYNPNTYQYHQLAIGVDSPDPAGYVHGLVTTLKTALIHPIVQNLPLDLGSGVSIFRNIHAALGLVNINFPDRRRDENSLTLDGSRLIIEYHPEKSEAARIKTARDVFRKALWKLSCVAPRSMTRMRPMGASVHYAGVLPMADRPARLTCSKECRSHDFSNLYFADGTTFPALPSKNLTFTLMANAVRVAEEAF
jgi:choline dehydrogenase-like flavoprotein